MSSFYGRDSRCRISRILELGLVVALLPELRRARRETKLGEGLPPQTRFARIRINWMVFRQGSF